ncbi:heavy metal transporter [Sphingomonas histidinilytica]|jgi:mercuric ion binding protein|uniref:heavy-metal-associated domain-containing protein n=1 Tax=Rhizorhabdus histidinilytica TaxID=439228 RepID=UPI001ADB13F3|nr:cation transporter [Rhizorhabdus histidinilytica]MBO9378122.1 heavy metal transporter [Rhizorhabdus histidinilytica]
MRHSFTLAAGAFTLAAASILSASVLSPPAAAARTAATQTATFAIQNMTCALCPVTVKSAMERVRGVRSVRVDFDAKTATVVFDPQVATLQAIAAASTNAGYPATKKAD